METGRPFSNFLFFLFIINIFTIACIYKSEAQHSNSTYPELKISSLPKHDKSPGETIIKLHSVKDSSIEKEYMLEGVWHYIAYNQKDKKHIIGGLFQVGAWLPMCEIRYIDDITSEMKLSTINKSEWYSFIAVPDESGKYIALTGKYDGKNMVLYVLNTSTDRIQILGKPPQPPPVDSSFFNNEMLQEKWEWGAPYTDGYTEMDEGIINFDKSGNLRVSIGKDSPLKRAVIRKKVIYKLIK